MAKRLDQQQGAMDELKEAIGGIRNAIEGAKGTTDGLKDSMHNLQRSLLGYLLGFTLVILASLLGTLGAVLSS